MPNTAALRSVRQQSFDDGASHVALERRAAALPELHLVEELLGRSAEAGPLAGYSVGDTQALMHVARWSKDFLTQPHPELGRSGHVCPYVSASIREQRFLLSVLHGAESQPRETDRTILRLGQYFSTLEPTAGRSAQKKTIVILFPDLPQRQTGDIINGMHQRLKPHFLRAGMMLGEFYRGSSKPGLHNDQFRPLRSDVPLLVIRAMLPGDIAFLSDQARFVRPYIRNFEARGCAEIRSYLEQQGASLCDAQRAMLLQQVAAYEASVGGGGRARDTHYPPAFESQVRPAVRLGAAVPRFR